MQNCGCNRCMFLLFNKHNDDTIYWSSDLASGEAEWNTEVVFNHTGIGKSKSAKVSNFYILGYNDYCVALSFHWLQMIIVIMTLWNSAGSISTWSTYLKSSFSKIQKSTLYRSKYRIIESPISYILSLFAKFYMIVCPKMALKPYIEALISKISKYWYWLIRSKYRHRKYQNSKPYRT